MMWLKLENGDHKSGRYLVVKSPHRYRRWTLDVDGRAYGLFGTIGGAKRAAAKLETMKGLPHDQN